MSRREQKSSEPDAGALDQAPVAVTPAPAPPLARVLTLQAAVGNRAVASMLQRQPLTMDICREDDTPESVIKRYIDNHRIRLGDMALKGELSRAEAVDLIRTYQPLARTIPPEQVEKLISANGLQLPEHRLKVSGEGIKSELAATIANLGGVNLPKAEVKGERGELRLSVAGAMAKTKIGGATVTAEAKPGGPEVKAEGGGVEAKASGAWDGRKGEISVGAGKAELSAEFERKEHVEWKLKFTLQVRGPKVAPVDELQKTVGKAQRAIVKIGKHLADGGLPTDDAIKWELDDVEKAMKQLSEATKEREQKVGVTVEGWGGTTETDIPGGGTAQGLGAGVGVRISF
jgi:hypothetical protein